MKEVGARAKNVGAQIGYPPDLQEAATMTVLGQAELLAAEWAIVTQ
ncbi:MAG TPA: hypothetical protein PKD55_10815 [Bellilinea sp.]|nr:hypothetical protein [Bellilinea sp.]